MGVQAFLGTSNDNSKGLGLGYEPGNFYRAFHGEAFSMESDALHLVKCVRRKVAFPTVRATHHRDLFDDEQILTHTYPQSPSPLITASNISATGQLGESLPQGFKETLAAASLAHLPSAVVGISTSPRLAKDRRRADETRFSQRQA